MSRFVLYHRVPSPFIANLSQSCTGVDAKIPLATRCEHHDATHMHTQVLGSAAIVTATLNEIRIWSMEGERIGQFGRDHWDIAVGMKLTQTHSAAECGFEKSAHLLHNRHCCTPVQVLLVSLPLAQTMADDRVYMSCLGSCRCLEPAHTDFVRESRDDETEVIDEGGGDDDDDGMGELLSRLWVSESVQGSPGSPIATFEEEIPEEVRCPWRFATVIQRVSRCDRMPAEDHLFLLACCMIACPKRHSVLADRGL